MQETPQLLQALEALIAALKAQLQIESARAQTAEQERSALIQTLVTLRQDRAGGMVNSKEKARRVCWLRKEKTKARTTGTTSSAGFAAEQVIMVEIVETTSQKIKERAKSRAKATGKKDDWKENKPQSYRKEDEKHADGWWTTANDQTLWETEKPVGGLEIDNTEGCDSKLPRRSIEEDRTWTDPLKYDEHSYERVRRWQRP